MFDSMSASDCLTFIESAERQKALLEAQTLRAKARFSQLEPGSFASLEIASLLGMSPQTAAYELEFSSHMIERTPETLAALERGDIDFRRAKAIHDLTSPLTEEQARAVEQRALAGGRRGTPTRFRDAVRRAVLKVDPDGARRRHEQRRKDRDVRKLSDDDGMGQLWAMLTADEATAAYDRIDKLARRAKTAGDTRTLGQRRADVLMDLVLGKNQEHVKVVVNVTMPLTTLMGLNQHPGELSGYGSITAEKARELAQNATWRRILTDPIDGRVLEVSRRRRPSAALADHVRLRDKTCRFPACNKPAELCELDHTIPYEEGGETSAANLAPLCTKHHDAKDHGWRVIQVNPGYFIWTSPENRTYTVTPDNTDDNDDPPF